MQRQIDLAPKALFSRSLSRLCLAVVIAALGLAKPAAATVTDIYNFGSTATDVLTPQPFGNIAVGADGHFYSTAPDGAAHGYGGIFRLSTGGVEQVKYKFKTSDDPTCQPGLNLGAGGDMYGTCYGIAGSTTDSGFVYKYTPSGTSITHVPCGFNGANGANPDEPPILASDGNYYGTTAWGGTHGYGTIYVISSVGVCTPAIYSFTGGTADGRNPHSLMQEVYTAGGANCTAGASRICLVGAAESGGANSCGTIFQFIPSPVTLTVLHAFNCTVDGQAPVAAPIQPKSGGPLYSTTYEGGANNDGTIFRLTPTGTSTASFHLMHTFLAATDGAGPQDPLVRYYDGNLYGTCINGGNAGGWLGQGQGTIFKITTSGAFTTEYMFAGSTTTGANPAGGLILHDKAMYGDTVLGGASNKGIFYSFMP